MNERKSIIGSERGDGFITFTVAGAGQLQVMVGNLAQDIITEAIYHGIEQKVRDAGAMSRDTKTGRSASPAEKFAAMQAVVDNLHNGLWNAKRTAQRALNRACLFAAVASVRGVAPERVEAKFRGYEDNVLRSFLEVREIAAEYARLTTPEKDTAGVEAMLAELE